MPIILGCPFLVTFNVIIDIIMRGFHYKWLEEKLEFNPSQAMSSPSMEDPYYQIDVGEKV